MNSSDDLTVTEVSIVMRCRDEESWIFQSVKMLNEQSVRSFELILVDNNSRDRGPAIALQHANFPVRVIKLDKFIPGLAINKGVMQARGRIVVCLSSHCVPTDIYWLANLIAPLDRSTRIVASYGRQLPVAFTAATDMRDLFLTFGPESRIQDEDPFFHNANSAFYKDVWEDARFDENLPHIEDRAWGAGLVARKYRIAYVAEASVFHHHGLHHENSFARAMGVAETLKSLVQPELYQSIPKFMRPENCPIICICTASSTSEQEAAHKYLKNFRYIDQVVFVGSSELREGLGNPLVSMITHEEIGAEIDEDLNILFLKAVRAVEKNDDYFFGSIYLNSSSFDKNCDLDLLISHSLTKGLDTCFFARPNYSHFWRKSSNGDWVASEDSFAVRKNRTPVFEAAYGKGTFVKTNILRSGRIIGLNVGILES